MQSNFGNPRPPPLRPLLLPGHALLMPYFFFFFSRIFFLLFFFC